MKLGALVLDEFQAAIEIEKAVLDISPMSSDEEFKSARLIVRSVFQEFSEIGSDNRLTLAETFEKISEKGSKSSLRSISIFILRLSSVPGFFPKQVVGSSADAKILSLIEPHLQNFYKRFDIDRKSQTYEKLDKLNEVHRYVCEKLACLNQIPGNIETITAERQLILKSLGDATVKSYLSPYEFSRIRASVEAILTQIVEFSSTTDATFNRRFKELLGLLSDELLYCDSFSTFITKNYYRPFLKIISDVAESEAARSKQNFICEINGRKGSKFRLDKKYPLHHEDEIIRIFVPLVNTGPGIADHVMAFINTKNDSVLIYNEEIDLGSVTPGDFVLPVSFSVVNPTSSIVLDLLVSWMVIGDPDEKLVSIAVTIDAQSADVDWESLVSLNPYSLDIATGTDFHGRKDKVNRLVSRAAAGKMQSSYITGQRRVGKSSLARAVEDKIRLSEPDCCVLNIECGDFKHPNAVSTVNSLGSDIEMFLSQYLPEGVQWNSIDVNGSLAGLSRLASRLEQLSPSLRFLILIDEFDEINQELYKFSEVAETFFLNLRSLSGKRNLSFCLIGAEKMSFVMSSQGEKLNKFSKESLDIFKQEEWQDYEEIVKGNMEGSVIWLDNAIRYLYNITNGHPYFTKQICSKVFDNAISSRDSQISEDEVGHAVDELIPELDVNSFQHFWRDGILGDLAEVEIITLKRCRILVGYARVKRLGLDPTVENIQRHVHSNQISEIDIYPILSDFCRRGVLFERQVESAHSFGIVIPLFERWLINQGFNCLIADQLGDELEEKRQKEEDDAYVKDAEISRLLERWPTYRGVQVTVHLVRDWLSQIESHINQRLLFKLLENMRFFGESEVREILKVAHERERAKFKVVVRTSKVQRRKDVWITYVDGPGKSGAQFSSYYAEENLISTTCIKEISEIDSSIGKGKLGSGDVSNIIIIDDFIGTGASLSAGLLEFYRKNGEGIKRANVNVMVVVVCATKIGEDDVRKTLASLDENSDLVVCESLAQRHFAFDESAQIWGCVQNSVSFL
tara:strand:+ start:935 stop:4006 length:3072 start_codon:yes stop_codon:yes gene_type:complete